MLSRRLILPALFLILSSPALARNTEPTLLTATKEVKAPQKQSFDGWESILYLYGGPGTLEGKFETTGGVPDPQDWYGVDASDEPDDWQRSIFNAENLAGRGSGNHAMWIGRTAEQEPDWGDAPGYGNNWDARLVWRSDPLSDPQFGRTVELDFHFNHESEPGYDFLYVEYERAGQWILLLTQDGTNSVDGVFSPPGVRYSDLALGPVYEGGDYGGENGDQIVLRLHFQSDGAASDEDGFIFISTAGAVQADEFLVEWVDGGVPQSSFEDFEGPGPYAWVNEALLPVGDFAKVRLGMGRDLPCQASHPGAWVFFDDDTPPSNGNGVSTGGETSETYDYGTPEGYVVNHSGGLRGDDSPVTNEIWSPPILLDLPGPEDDDPTLGIFGRFKGYEHTTHFQPESFLHYRYSTDEGTSWERWRERSFVFFAPRGPLNFDRRLELTKGMPVGATHIQLKVVRIDLGQFQFIYDDRTPSPYIDEVEVFKAHAPVDIFLWNDLLDAFPRAGGLDLSTPSARDSLDVPLNPHPDGFLSVNVDEPQGVLQILMEDVVLRWTLDANPLFENALRDFPPGTTLEAGVGRLGGDVFTGEFTAASQIGLDIRFELPDEDFLYPGDLLRYYVEVTDSRGFVSTLPADIEGFSDGKGFDPRFVVRGLPTLVDGGGTHPGLLVYLRSHDPGLAAQSLSQLGFSEGVDYDVFRMPGYPAENQDHLGQVSWRGAGLEQLDGYAVILEVGARQIFYYDETPDESAHLAAWHALTGPRAYFLFDRTIVDRVGWPTPGPLGAQVLGLDTSEGPFEGVHPLIDDDRAPAVVPQLTGYVAVAIPDYSCRKFGMDYLRPAPGALRGHVFTPSSAPFAPYATDAAASVYQLSDAGDGRKLGVSFPFEFEDLRDQQFKSGGLSQRTLLLGELLDDAGTNGGSPPTGAGPASRPGIHGLNNQPNPFNPSTEIRFELGRSGLCQVQVYDLRGQLVRIVHDGFLPAGAQSLQWSGRDEAGVLVASGIYFVRVEANGTRETIKVGLLK